MGHVRNVGKKKRDNIKGLALGLFVGCVALFMAVSAQAEEQVKEKVPKHENAKTASHESGVKKLTRKPAEVMSVDVKEQSLVARLASPYTDAIDRVNAKMRNLITAEKNNHILRLENANLRVQLESIQFACQEREAKHRTKDLGLRLSEITGGVVGRTLASIQYRPPAHLLPSQMRTLAVTYFRSNRPEEIEKSAVIMTFLTSQEKDRSLHTAENYLMTGAAWYRVDNYKMADGYFEKVLKYEDSDEVRGPKAQARLWKALVAQRLKKRGESQVWLRKLLDNHPHSREAAWVNSREELSAPEYK